jgi:hypothetical protein
MERLVREEMVVLVAVERHRPHLRQQEIRHLEAHHKEIMEELALVLQQVAAAGLVE